jgi:hypothetical protein
MFGFSRSTVRKLRQYSLGLPLAFLVGVNANAAPTPLDNDISVSTNAAGTADVLTISPANDSGISVNRFSSFTVTNRELHIVNVPKMVRVTSGDQVQESARLTVIIADNFAFNNTVKLVGPAANVLFITANGNGSIACNSCRFENFLRVSLATATPEQTIHESASSIGELTPGGNSSIAINYLDAPGVVDLDILTHRLSLSGVLETHQRAVADSNGGYITQANGNLRIGTGSTNLLLGPLTWDYDQHQLTSVSNTNASHTVGGSIRSSAIKMSAAGDLVVNTTTETAANLLSSTAYRGAVFIPNEGVDIQTFSNSDLTISGDQRSQGVIKLKSTGDLAVSSAQTDINAPQMQLIAGATLSNVGRLEGDYIDLAGDRLINQGDLTAGVDINLWAHKQLANQYGGTIKADTVRLQSVTQAVRNGSRTPYQSQEEETDYLFNMDNYLNQLDPSQLGTFYSLEEVDINNGSYVMAEDNSASIVANRVEVQGQAFENINPYFEKVINQQEVTLNPKYIGQVLVSAESYLGIAANNYIVNSSAHIVLNRDDGVFEFNTGLFTNERYRTLSQLSVNRSSTTERFSSYDFAMKLGEARKERDCYYSWGYSDRKIKGCMYGDRIYNTTYVSHDHTNVSTEFLTVSPPALVAVFGRANLAATQAILNNTAYMEFFRDVSINSPLVNDIGLKNESLSQTLSEAQQGYQTTGDAQEPFTLYLEFVSSYTTINPSELDSLFSIRGDLQASDTLGWFRNHSPLDGFIEQAIDNLVDTYYPGISSSTSVSSVEDAKQTGIIRVGNNQHSLMDQLFALAGNLANSVSNFFAELNWWSE